MIECIGNKEMSADRIDRCAIRTIEAACADSSRIDFDSAEIRLTIDTVRNRVARQSRTILKHAIIKRISHVQVLLLIHCRAKGSVERTRTRLWLIWRIAGEVWLAKHP